MKRNLLTEEEAKTRISAQLDNYSVVQHSNIVFSSEWENEFSQIQVNLYFIIKNSLN